MESISQRIEHTAEIQSSRYFPFVFQAFTFSYLSHILLSNPMHHDISTPSTSSRDAKHLQQQLLSSLKFHHRKTLQELPLDLALEAMMQAWNSCQPQ